MPLLEHLRELRVRLRWALLALGAGTAVGYTFFDPIFQVLRHPYCALPTRLRALQGSCALVATGPFDGFLVRVKVSVIAGALLSSPVWLYQLWAFLAPGLHRRERRATAVVVTAAVALFSAGGACCYVVLPTTLRFLSGAAGDQAVTLLSLTTYLSWLQAMLLLFGVSFELPLLVVALNRVGVLSAATLARWNRGIVFVIVAFAGAVTPSPDPFSMLALAVPMVVLFELGVLVTRLHDRRVARARPALDPDEPTPWRDLVAPDDPAAAQLAAARPGGAA